MSKIYISGPITGRMDFRRKFDDMSSALMMAWYKPLDPSYLEAPKGTDKPWVYCMKNAMKMLLEADGIMMLEGWQESRGACLEHYVAQNVGIHVYYQTDIGKNNGKDFFKDTHLPMAPTDNRGWEDDSTYKSVISEVKIAAKDVPAYIVHAKTLGWEVRDYQSDKETLSIIKKEWLHG